MARFMNGSEPFLHPVTGVLVGPFQWYEGFSHRGLDNELLPEVDEVVESEELTGGGNPEGDLNPEGEVNPEGSEGEGEDEDEGEPGLFDDELTGEAQSEGEAPKKGKGKGKKKDEEAGE
jgi:hypothetical protein